MIHGRARVHDQDVFAPKALLFQVSTWSFFQNTFSSISYLILRQPHEGGRAGVWFSLVLDEDGEYVLFPKLVKVTVRKARLSDP